MLNGMLAKGIDPSKSAETSPACDMQYPFGRLESLESDSSRISGRHAFIACASPMLAGGAHPRAVYLSTPHSEMFQKESVIPGFAAKCRDAMGMKPEGVESRRMQKSQMADRTDVGEV